MTMYIQTQNQYAQFESDELTDLLGQINFTINKFGLWQSDHDTKANYITNDIEIVYYKEGGSVTTIGNKKYTCPPHSFLIIEPYKLNTSKNIGNSSYSYYFFHFDIEPLSLRQQFISLLTKHGHLIYKEEIKNFEEMLDRLLIEAREKEIGYSSIITSALIRVIVEIIRAQLKRTGDNIFKISDLPHIELVNDAISYIHNHLHEPIKLVDMSMQLGVSTSMLYKSFIAILATPPLAYIHQQKILYAQKMLVSGHSVTTIANDLGYSSAYHLSKTFKQITGISPREYKKNIKLL